MHIRLVSHCIDVFTHLDEDFPEHRRTKQDLSEATEISVPSVNSCSKFVFSLRLCVRFLLSLCPFVVESAYLSPDHPGVPHPPHVPQSVSSPNPAASRLSFLN
jgi:hypothetical protein